MTDIEENLFNETWKLFNKAADVGFSKAHFNPTDAFLNEIRSNNAVFSAFRVHRQQNDIAALLTDNEGKLRSFSEFSKLALPISDHYNKTWLQTEYDTAVIRAHRAAEWKQFEEEADVLPNLEWIETTSPNPGEDHRPFWGTIRSINDGFWNKHRPGDRWRCKCGLEATDKEPNTKTYASSVKDEPQPGLDNNPAKDGMLFSKTHPYYKNAYDGAKKAVKNFIDKQGISSIVKSLGEYAGYKKVKKFKNGGEFFTSKLIKKSTDSKLINSIGTEFARTGAKVKATPNVHFKSDEYKQIYSSLIGTKYDRKCPDLLINGKFYEVESYIPPFNKKKINRMIGNGLKQSPNIIINNTKGASDRYIKKIIYNHLNVDEKINEVWVYEKGKIRLLYKNSKGE